MNKPVQPIVEFKQDLRGLSERSELVLPSNVSPEAFNNAAIVAVQDNPGLLSADRASLFKSLRRAAAQGLVPDGREGALVTFKTKDKASGQYINAVQWMPMVFGLIKMARRSGTIKDIRAHIVYQAEMDQGRFEYVVGDKEELTHHPMLTGDRGDPVAAYAIATMSDGLLVREFMTADEIDTVRRAGSSQRLWKNKKPVGVSDEPIGIWKDWSSEMWKKTVIRRLSKRLDLSAEDVRRIVEEQEFDHMRDVTPKTSAFAAAAKAAVEDRRKNTVDHDRDIDADMTKSAQDPEPHSGKEQSGTVGGEEPSDAGTTDGADTIDTDSEAYQLGFEAGHDGFPARDESPLKDRPADHDQWLAGYDAGAAEKAKDTKQNEDA